MIEAPRGFGLSPQQRRIWTLLPERSSARSRLCLQVSPTLDPQRLEEAVWAVVARNPVLTTAFRPVANLKYPAQLPGEAPESIEIQWEDGADGLRMRLSFSPLCVDRRTLEHLAGQIAAEYAGRPAPTDEIPYPQYAEWANAQLTDADSAEGIEHWKRESSRTVAEVKLPSRTRRLSGTVRSVGQRIDPDLLRRIEAVAKQSGSTLATVFFTAWYVLLSRLTGESSLAVGEIVEGREQEIVRSALGVFARQVPIHVHLRNDLTVPDSLKTIGKLRQAAWEWSDSFDCDRLATVPFGFQYEEYRRHHPTVSGELTIESREAWVDRAGASLLVTRHEDGADVELHFDTATEVHRSDADRMLGYLLNILAEMVTAGGNVLNQLKMLSSDERRWLLDEINSTSTDSPKYASFHEWFQETASRRPGEIAVACNGESLTFRQLETRSNQLARHLQQRGVEPEMAIGVLMDRSVDVAVALLAIWKAGGVYVPLDPLRAESRLRFVLEDADVQLVLVHESVRRLLPEGRVPCIVMDGGGGEWANCSHATPASTVAPESLAYIIYTSGSTGTPRGVMVSHGSLVNLTEALQRGVYSEATVGRVSLNAPLTFDASIKQVAALALGIAVDIVPEHVRSDPWSLLEYLQKYDVEVLDCTPYQFRLLLQAGWMSAGARRPRYVLLGGERIDDGLLRKLQDDTRTSFFNLYGPTECTVDVAIARIGREDAEATVGKPLANVRTYVLDGELNPVPWGVVGELYVAGRGLARGYLGRPDWTSTAFVADPFAGNGERMYRTGDLASFTEEGFIRVHGRVDRQLKVRGFRVEPAEIEKLLREQPGVRDAAVVSRQAAGSDPRLVAYVAGSSADGIDPQKIRDAIRPSLPEYMVPAAIVRVDVLPVSANGKVDYAALPDERSVTATPASAYMAPRGRLETEIADIWKALLRIERVGIRDNFFDLGGHSLLMARVHTALRRQFDCRITMVEMFRHPTVELLAAYVSGEPNAPDARFASALERAAQRRRRNAPDED